MIREAASDLELRKAIFEKKDSLFGFEMDEDSQGAYHQEIVDFLNPFLSELWELNYTRNRSCDLDVVLKHLTDYVNQHSEEKTRLMKLMKIDKIYIPYISLDLAADVILTYNQIDEDDPLVAVFRMNPVIGQEVYKFGVFLDRYDTNKEVICSLVWSTLDNFVICLPKVGLNPYPVCWGCEKNFGTMTCSKCGVARYCSKQCQVDGWKSSHRTRCGEMAHYVSLHGHLTFM